MHTNEQPPSPSRIHTTKLIIPSNHYPHHLDFHLAQTPQTSLTPPKKNRTYNPDLILAFQCYIPGILSNSRTYDSIVRHPSPLIPASLLSIYSGRIPYLGEKGGKGV